MSLSIAIALMLPPQPGSECVFAPEETMPLQAAAAAQETSRPTDDAPPPPADPAAAAFQTEQASTQASDDVVVRARPGGDPLRTLNAPSFAATQAVDEAFTGPAALAYKRVVPDPVRSGLRNFFNNLHEPNVALSFLLQLKPGKAAETLGRFAINTTLGVGGLIDVAKRRPFKLPRRLNGFGDTLGYYGVGPGPFFFLPLIGPTTLRDLIGGGVDRFVGFSYIRGPFSGRAYALSTAAVRVLDRRAENDDRARMVRASADPYETRRAIYMRKRRAEIDHLRGRDAPSAQPAVDVGQSQPPPAAAPPTQPTPAPLP